MIEAGWLVTHAADCVCRSGTDVAKPHNLHGLNNSSRVIYFSGKYLGSYDKNGQP